MISLTRILHPAAWLVAGVAYSFSAFIPAGAMHRILIPADRPGAISRPCAVAVVTEEGDRGLRIAPGVGRGWANEAGGSATYRFYIPADGTYTLWSYCLWGGVCTNAVYAQIDESRRFILGNDPVYGKWHWVRSLESSLSRGTHELTLSNHSDGISIQRMLLLSDRLDRPDRQVHASYDLFYDGFDGCDGGNYATWQLDTKRWQLHQPLGKEDLAHRILQGRADDPETSVRPTFAVVGENNWSDYSIHVRTQALQAGRVGICFNWQGPDDYTVVQWRPIQSSETAVTRVEFVQVTAGQANHLGAFDASLAIGRWQEIGLLSGNQELIVLVDGSVTGRLPFHGALRGKIGLLVADGGRAWFDELHVRSADSSTLDDVLASNKAGRTRDAAR